jgi:hypothetical protein
MATPSRAFWSAAIYRRFLSFRGHRSRCKESGVETPLPFWSAAIHRRFLLPEAERKRR